LLLVVIGVAAIWTFGGGLDAFIDDIMNSAFDDAAEQSDDPVGAIIGGAVAAIILAVVLLTFLFIALLLVVSALGIATFGLWRGERALRRAEGAKALVLTDEAAIGRTVRRIKRGAGRTFAPRLVVVKVHDAIWREVVHELARDASVALIDVSEPTEHLLWEVDLLRREASMHMLAIGRRDLVEGIAAASAAGSVAAQLRDLLVGQDVLVYDVGRDGRPARRFSANLGAALERIGV
jgi:membrane protein implicated in regulation of membrane protease activity